LNLTKLDTLEKLKPDLLPVCADCRSTSLEEQAKPAHPTSVGNPAVVARKPSLKRLRQVVCRIQPSCRSHL